jgi:anti-anti-sigma factor
LILLFVFWPSVGREVSRLTRYWPATDNKLMSAFEVRKSTNWNVISVGDRVDSVNLRELQSQIDHLLQKRELYLVIDLRQAIFLSLPSIKYFAVVADQIGKLGGSLALLAPSEKIKRQIHIYASLEEMKLFRSWADLERADGEPVPFVRESLVRREPEETDASST